MCVLSKLQLNSSNIIEFYLSIHLYAYMYMHACIYTYEDVCVYIYIYINLKTGNEAQLTLQTALYRLMSQKKNAERSDLFSAWIAGQGLWSKAGRRTSPQRPAAMDGCSEGKPWHMETVESHISRDR